MDVTLDGRRFVVAHSEPIAKETKAHRAALPEGGHILSEVEGGPHPWSTKWHHPHKRKGPLSAGGSASSPRLPQAEGAQALLDEHGMVRWEPNKEIRAWENLIDGKLLLETTNRTMSPEEVVHQYKELQEIERCFRTLKRALWIYVLCITGWTVASEPTSSSV